MMRRLLAALAALVAALPLAAAAEPLAIGVQTHFAFDPSRTDVAAFRSWMQRSGFTSARDEMFWGDVEDDAGSFALRRGALRTQQVWASMPRPFAGLLTVDFGHPRHDRGAQPASDATREAFARYAAHAAGSTSPGMRWVEVWNEWNSPAAWEREAGSRGDARDYVELVRTTRDRLKAEHPGVRVLAGSAADDSVEWRWTRQAIAHGLLAHTDGLAVHLYNHCSAPALVGSGELIARLDALHAAVAASGSPRMPFYVTEVGWPTHQGPCGVGEQAAVAHSVRFLLEASVRPWVEGVWFYELQDGGDDARSQEHRFGLLRRDGTEKPAGCALRELGAQIAARPTAFLEGRNAGAAAFRQGDSDRWLVWTRGKAQQPVTVRLDSASGRTSFISHAVCGLPAADMQVAAQGRSATVRLAPGGVHVIDVPAGASLTMEEVR